MYATFEEYVTSLFKIPLPGRQCPEKIKLVLPMPIKSEHEILPFERSNSDENV